MKKLLMIMSVVFCLLCSNAISANAETYTYDELNRITSVTYDDGGIIEYDYDNTGNIISKVVVEGEVDSSEEVVLPDDEDTDPPKTEIEPGEQEKIEAPEEQDKLEDQEEPDLDKVEKENNVIIEETTAGKVDGEKLSKTATYFYNSILIGLILLMIGGILYLKFRRKTE